MSDKLTVEPVAGIGDPSSPLYGEVLSPEDEKRLDDKGELVVEGLSWSKAKTGLYLSVLASHKLPYADRPALGGGVCAVPAHLKAEYTGPLNVALLTTRGKPTFNCEYSGACLELPLDLGRDGIKRQYVTEWLVNTASEALGFYGVDLRKPEDVRQVGLWVSQAAEDAIRSTGL